MSYSQRGEEPVILEVFKDQPKGRFLDIGAWDGKTFSNTLALVEKGWSGVCVEPSPMAWGGLMATHRDRPQIELVCAAVMEKPGLVTFWDSGGDAISTTVPAHRDLWRDKGAKNFREIAVVGITVPQLLKRCPGPYDFVNIDTEGTSTDVLVACVNAGLFPKLYCIEHDKRIPEIRTLLLPHAYRTAHASGENLLMVRQK